MGRLMICAALLSPLLAAAAEPVPEIRREGAAPQAVGVVHTVRQIPEACARIEGRFTGQPAQPYAMAVARTHPQCQPRARLVDYAQARPSEATGWKLNDRIAIPSAACPSQQAVLRVWRKPAQTQAPALDGQGQARVYLQDAQRQAAGGGVAPAAMYAVGLEITGAACR